MLDVREKTIVKNKKKSLINIEVNLKKGKYYAGIYFLPIFLKEEEEPLVKKIISEGIKDNTLKIKELESSTVPYVKIENTGPEPILGYRGNIIRGGGQNRQIVHSFIIGPYETLKVPVQCIQEGRWNPYSNRHFTSSGEFTSSTLRYSKKNQGDVWRDVTKTLRITTTISLSKNYTDVLDKIKETTRIKRIKKDIKNINDKIQQGWKSLKNILKRKNKEKEKRKRKEKIKHNKKIEKRIEERVQQIWEDFKTPLDRQVGLFTVMIDPFEWLNNGKKIYKKNLEIFENNQIYKKIHEELIISFITDIAPLPNDEKRLNIPFVEGNNILKFIEDINKENWKKVKSIGKEERKELSNSNEMHFGEYISFKDKILHLIYATDRN